ncbi:hypothetical protein [Desulfovermiculus halophilus]|jgi:hypothetical protein|uniref:hypothetical protein n=1 Tax=Desulfovermiculus halophilus TaxID=339722 RepID=UPI00129463D2|nr:hypothetical protein [Desulfovermiculus halophilus]
MDIDPDPDFDYELEERKSQQWVTTFNRYRNRLYVSLAKACPSGHVNLHLYAAVDDSGAMLSPPEATVAG